MTPNPNWLTVPAAAKVAGRTEGRIHQKIKDKTLTAVKSGRDWLIDPASLDQWIATRQAGRPWHKEQK